MLVTRRDRRHAQPGDRRRRALGNGRPRPPGRSPGSMSTACLTRPARRASTRSPASCTSPHQERTDAFDHAGDPPNVIVDLSRPTSGRLRARRREHPLRAPRRRRRDRRAQPPKRGASQNARRSARRPLTNCASQRRRGEQRRDNRDRREDREQLCVERAGRRAESGDDDRDVAPGVMPRPTIRASRGPSGRAASQQAKVLPS